MTRFICWLQVLNDCKSDVFIYHSMAWIQELLMRAHNPMTLSITDTHTPALPLFHFSSWQLV